MSKKRLWKNLGALLLTLCLVLIYLLVYLMPSLVDINRTRREIKDVNLKILDLRQEVGGITFSDPREKRLFRRAEEQYRKRFPILKNPRIRKRWLSKLTDFVDASARKQGIASLVMMDDTDVSRSLIQRGIKDGDEIFGLIENDIRDQSDDSADIPLPYPQPGFRVFFLGFPASIGSGFHLIAELLNLPFHLEFGRIRLVAGNEDLWFLIKLRVFHGREKSRNQEAGPADRMDGSLIDLNSPLLLKPVYLYFSPAPRMVVPDFDGYSIFRNTGRDRR
jgi:hypothetical protein